MALQFFFKEKTSSYIYFATARNAMRHNDQLLAYIATMQMNKKYDSVTIKIGSDLASKKSSNKKM